MTKHKWLAQFVRYAVIEFTDSTNAINMHNCKKQLNMNQNCRLTWNEKEWDEYSKNDDLFDSIIINILPWYTNFIIFMLGGQFKNIV